MLIQCSLIADISNYRSICHVLSSRIQEVDVPASSGVCVRYTSFQLSNLLLLYRNWPSFRCFYETIEINMKCTILNTKLY
jgi:hypothetical protein